MTTIFAISGSLRSDSLNTKLLHQARALAPAGVTVTIGSIRDVPLYDADVEARGVPPAVAALKDGAAAADAILLVSPEYNHSIPGTLKNTIDWMSRPPADIDRVFNGKAAGVIGASPGIGGTRMAQVAWLPVLHALGLRIYSGGMFALGQAHKAFDASGALTDEKTRGFLIEYMTGLAEWAARK
jgi:NAD(P)H-dependent FMN reductase